MDKRKPKALWTHPSLGPITFRRYVSILGGQPYRRCSAWLCRRARRWFRRKVAAELSGRKSSRFRKVDRDDRLPRQ